MSQSQHEKIFSANNEKVVRAQVQFATHIQGIKPGGENNCTLYSKCCTISELTLANWIKCCQQCYKIDMYTKYSVVRLEVEVP